MIASLSPGVATGIKASVLELAEDERELTDNELASEVELLLELLSELELIAALEFATELELVEAGGELDPPHATKLKQLTSKIDNAHREQGAKK